MKRELDVKKREYEEKVKELELIYSKQLELMDKIAMYDKMRENEANKQLRRVYLDDLFRTIYYSANYSYKKGVYGYVVENPYYDKYNNYEGDYLDMPTLERNMILTVKVGEEMVTVKKLFVKNTEGWNPDPRCSNIQCDDFIEQPAWWTGTYSFERDSGITMCDLVESIFHIKTNPKDTNYELFTNAHIRKLTKEGELHIDLEFDHGS